MKTYITFGQTHAHRVIGELGAVGMMVVIAKLCVKLILEEIKEIKEGKS